MNPNTFANTVTIITKITVHFVPGEISPHLINVPITPKNIVIIIPPAPIPRNLVQTSGFRKDCIFGSV